MRTIVVGPVRTDDWGIQRVSVWFRFPVASATRQTYYNALNGNSQPASPGDYTNPGGVDFAEIQDLQAGRYVERPGFEDVIDPTATLTAVQTRLVNIYNVAAARFKAVDDSSLAQWGSYYDGTTWNKKSA